MFAGVHLALEASARFSERYLGAYLWKEQDYLRLFSPANHAGRGRHRLLIYGPSEAREGLIPEVLVSPSFDRFACRRVWGAGEWVTDRGLPPSLKLRRASRDALAAEALAKAARIAD